MTVWNGTLPTPAAGQEILASDIQIAIDALSALTGAWTTYTPTWTSTGTAPALGNGVIDGRYLQADRMVIYTGSLTMGTTTTYGTGAYRITLPVSATTTTLNAGAALTLDSSAATAQTPAVARIADAPRLRFYGPNGEVGATAPFTWATSDQLVWTILYMGQ